MAVHPPPGPPPRPPADFHSIPLPTETLPAGTILYRIHRIRPAWQDPLFFGPRAPERGGWDSPTHQYGICYLAWQSWASFAETFLRQHGRRNLEEVELEARALARVELGRDLVVVSLDGPNLARIGADASVVHGDYECTAAWAAAIHAHENPVVDGIVSPIRHDPHGYGVSVFDRARAALRVLDSMPLLTPSLAPELANWLDRYQKRLI